MATELDTKPVVPKYEAFVESQLARVRTRMRALEVGRSLLAIAVVSLGYFLIMAVFDLAVGGADDAVILGTRLAAFGTYVVVVVGLGAQLGMRLYRQINPFYVAKQLEDTLADAKNSVINWLDLKERALPGAIRGAVGQRAARELKQADPDKAVNPKSNWILGGACAALVLGLLILFALGPNQFGSLFRRAFAPFAGSGLGTKTEITLLTPIGGNATVPLNQRVDFAARIEGRFPKLGQPGAPRLLYRYQAADPYVPLPLDENADGNWVATLSSDQVLNGFSYKLAAGDTETPEYQIKVESLPHAQRFEVTYHYRPYRKLNDDKVTFPNEQAVIPRIIDYRGTEVELVVRTNRVLRQASIEMDSNGTKRDIPAEMPPDDPKALRVRLTLEQRGTFRILFTSDAGERNSDRSSYQIEVLDDQAPRVLLTKPGKDIALPANGTLQVEGIAVDDIGITGLVLRLQVLQGETKPALAPKLYREGKSFQFANGTYPDSIDYKDFVALDKLASAKNEPIRLKTGTILEYWLEATDNCDYPDAHANTGKSKAYKVTITDAAPNPKKQQEDRRQAEQQQKQHEQKQDKQNSAENQKRNQNQKAGGGGAQDEAQKRDFDDKMKKLQDQVNKDDQQKKESNEQKSNAGNNNQGTCKAGGGGANQADQKDATNGSQSGAKKEGGQKNQPGQGNDPGGSEQNKNGPAQAKGNPAAEKSKPGGDQQQGKQSSQADKGINKEPSPGQAKEAPGQAKAQGQEQAGKTASAKSGESARASSTDQPKSNEGLAKNGPRAKGDAASSAGNQAEPNSQNNPGSQAEGMQTQSKATQGSPYKPATAKGADPSEAKAPQGQGNHADAHGATDRDVKAAKNKLQDSAGEAQAKEQLERIAREAKDPQVRKAAQEALDGASQQGNANDQAGPKTGGPKDGNQQGSADGGNKGELKSDADTAKTAGAGQDSQGPKTDAKTGGTVNDFGSKGRGATDDVANTKPNTDFQKRAGDLQLETLRERVTPDVLKKLGWSDQDWQQFLREAQKYQVSPAKTARKDLQQRGTGSQIPGAALRPIDAGSTAPTQPLTTDHALVPPEIRNAQREFTTSPPGKQ